MRGGPCPAPAPPAIPAPEVRHEAAGQFNAVNEVVVVINRCEQRGYPEQGGKQRNEHRVREETKANNDISVENAIIVIDRVALGS